MKHKFKPKKKALTTPQQVLSRAAVVEARHRAYQLKWLRSLAGVTDTEVATALGIFPASYRVYEAGKDPVPDNLVEIMARNYGLDLSDVPCDVIAPEPFPHHPYPGQLRYGAMCLRALAEHRALDLALLSANDFLQLVDELVQPLPGYPI